MCQSQITLLPKILCDRMTAIMRQWHELCWNRVGSQVCLFVTSSLSVSLLCVCLHCTVSSAYTSVHNLATHMCHLPYNCHLHSQWARLRRTKVACHIHVSFVPALIETRRSGILLLFYFTTLICTAVDTANEPRKETKHQRTEAWKGLMSSNHFGAVYAPLIDNCCAAFKHDTTRHHMTQHHTTPHHHTTTTEHNTPPPPFP